MPGDPVDRRLAEHDRHAVDLRQALEARGDVDVVADRRIVEALRRAEIADAAVAGIDADADGDARVRAAGGLRLARHFSLSASMRRIIVSADRAAFAAWFGSSSGAFQNAMMASPMYLSIVPRFSRMISDNGVSRLLMKLVSSCAFMRSEIEVKLRTSQNSSVSSRTSPPSSSLSGWAMISFTTAGAT